jgi:hypothetical protein
MRKLVRLATNAVASWKLKQYIAKFAISALRREVITLTFLEFALGREIIFMSSVFISTLGGSAH